MELKLFTYVFDTEGGTDWTDEYTIMAENRESADEFIKKMKEKNIIPSNKKCTVLLAVTESGTVSIPSFWGRS